MHESRWNDTTGVPRSGLGVYRAPALTKREAEVLRLRARGFTSGEVGCRLRCSEQTAKNHIQRVYEKLGVRNIVEACLAMGWLDVPAESHSR